MKTPHGDNRQVIFINRNSLSNIEAVKHETATGEQKLRGAETELEVKGGYLVVGSR